MPTKPNYGGEQQNYVPQGNGDPSGEYADNEGGNVNFKVFKSPSQPAKESAKPIKTIAKPEKTEGEGGIGVKVTGQSEKESYDSFGKYLDSHYSGSKNIRQKIEESFKLGTPESMAMVMGAISGTSVLFQSGNTNYCQYGGFYNSPTLSLSALKTSRENVANYVPGEVFYHEIGHAIDSIYGTSYTDQFGKNKRTASSSVSLSSGKTLNQTIIDNMSSDSKGMGERFKKASDEVEKIKQSLYAKHPEYKEQKDKIEINKEQQMEARKQFDERKSAVSAKFLAGSMTYDEYQAEWEKIGDEETKDPELSRLQKERMDLTFNSPVYKIEQETANAINQEFGDVSDMFEASYGVRLTGMGHGSRYFSSREHPERRGDEFFAEYMSAKATNPASLKRIREYFPKQAAAAEELYQKIRKGEIKKWNQN